MNDELVGLLKMSYDEGARNALLSLSETLDTAIAAGIITDLAGVAELLRVASVFVDEHPMP